MSCIWGCVLEHEQLWPGLAALYVSWIFPDVPEVVLMQRKSSVHTIDIEQSQKAREQIQGSWKRWFDWL